MGCVAFPKQKKRGAKVRKGPRATIIQFPAQLVGDALKARWAWINHHWRNWNHEQLDGTFDDPRDWESTVRLFNGVAIGQGKDFNDGTMRRDIAERVAHIQQRVEVKDWLDSLGLDWDSVKSSEDALFFVYQRMKQPLPLGA